MPWMWRIIPQTVCEQVYITARIYFNEDYDYESSDMDNSGFFSEPNFKHGIMTPDIWDMFKSDWGQKVQ